MKEAKKLADKKKEDLTITLIYAMLKNKNKEIRDVFEMCLQKKKRSDEWTRIADE